MTPYSNNVPYCLFLTINPLTYKISAMPLFHFTDLKHDAKFKKKTYELSLRYPKTGGPNHDLKPAFYCLKLERFFCSECQLGGISSTYIAMGTLTLIRRV